MSCLRGKSVHFVVKNEAAKYFAFSNIFGDFALKKKSDVLPLSYFKHQVKSLLYKAEKFWFLKSSTYPFLIQFLAS